ncbi:hypothetical protein ACFY0G_32225 [Streptomyces sp. NPDC001552]|uniref:hypothetical protein n=1 Tax=Streptomyces sp. NPDC001552 TaxID=3364587 RepID=UPI0036B4BEAA
MTTRPERRLAAGHWLLASAPSIPDARRQWRDSGSTWLRTGALYSALMIPAAVMHAAAQGDGPKECAGRISDALEGGPVFFDPTSFRQRGGYTLLLPASAAHTWRVPSTLMHPPGSRVLVPAPDRCGWSGSKPWWVVPLESPGLLCSPELVACLATLGRRRIVPAGGELL